MSGLHAGDTTPALTGTATSAGVGVDLSTAVSAAVHIVRPDGTLITRESTHTGATGAWSLPWLVSELDLAGVYQTELQVEWPDGTVQTFGPSSFRVVPQLDGSTPPFAPPLTVVDNGDGTSTLTWS